MVSTAEYAAAHSISERRVRAIAAGGNLPAHRHGRVWVIEPDQTTATIRGTVTARPMGQRQRDALLESLGDQFLTGLTGDLRVRTAAHLRKLRTADNPAALLRAWLRGYHPTGFAHRALIARQALEGYDDRTKTRLRRPVRRFMSSPERLRNAVRDERAIHGISRDNLAETAHVTRALVDTIENARPTGDIPGIRRVVDALNIETLALPPVHTEA